MKNGHKSDICVGLLDNDVLSLRMMRALINQSTACKCIWTTTQVGRAIEACVDQPTRPDILLTDMALDNMTGVDVCRRIREKQSVTQFIGMTAYMPNVYVEHNHGLIAAILRKEDVSQIISTIIQLHEVHESCSYRSEQMNEQSIMQCPVCSRNHKTSLSANEIAVIKYYSQGLSTQGIIALTNKTKGTIRSYELRALNKLGASNRTEAVAICVRMNLFS